MEPLDDFEKACEDHFGMISASQIWGLHAICVRAGSSWDLEKPETMEIIVNKGNAADIYAWCRGLMRFNTRLDKGGMKKVKDARKIAHEFLVDEAQDPQTSIERKIELVSLTSKNNPNF